MDIFTTVVLDTHVFTYRMGRLEWKYNPSFTWSGVLEGEWKKFVARIGWVMAIQKKDAYISLQAAGWQDQKTQTVNR